MTASRTAANSIYVTPLLQAELDEMSGILQCEEGDSATAFSYFLESFDAFDKCKDGRAMSSLKYMCLCKVCRPQPPLLRDLLSAVGCLCLSGVEQCRG